MSDLVVLDKPIPVRLHNFWSGEIGPCWAELLSFDKAGLTIINMKGYPGLGTIFSELYLCFTENCNVELLSTNEGE